MSVVQALKTLTPRKTLLELMRRIDALTSQDAGSHAAHRRRPARLRIEQTAAMHFASTEVSEVQVIEPALGAADVLPDIRVIQRNFGLFAPYGPLPLHITEHAMHEKRFERNQAFERFLNLVSADMCWLHYRARSALHPALGSERARNPFVERVGSMAQLEQADAASASTARRHPAACRRGWPGLYAASARPLPPLQRMLTAYFGCAMRILPRTGRWMSVPAAAGQAPELGRWRLGSRAWDAQYTLDIEVGPIPADGFEQWRRRAPAVQALVAVVTDYAAGGVRPAVHVRIRTRPDMAGRIGRMRIGLDAWAHPGHGLRRLTVYEPYELP